MLVVGYLLSANRTLTIDEFFVLPKHSFTLIRALHDSCQELHQEIQISPSLQ